MSSNTPIQGALALAPRHEPVDHNPGTLTHLTGHDEPHPIRLLQEESPAVGTIGTEGTDVSGPTAEIPAYSFPTAEYLATMPEEIWLLQDLLPVGGAGVLFGDAKTGKSFAAIQLAATIAGGAPDWFGVPSAVTGPVLYIQLDTPQSLWKERLLEVQEAGYDLSNLQWADRDTFKTWPFDISDPHHAARLAYEVDRVKPVAVIIDTLRESNNANENDSTEQKAAVAKLVAAVQPAALVLISHAKKPQVDASTDTVNAMRGSNYVVGRMDAICHFRKKTLNLIGRAMEEQSIKIKRLPVGTWDVDDSEKNVHLAKVMADPLLTTRSMRVASLMALSAGKTENACRLAVRRAEKAAAAKAKKAAKVSGVSVPQGVSDVKGGSNTVDTPAATKAAARQLVDSKGMEAYARSLS